VNRLFAIRIKNIRSDLDKSLMHLGWGPGIYVALNRTLKLPHGGGNGSSFYSVASPAVATFCNTFAEALDLIENGPGKNYPGVEFEVVEFREVA
jgi:hypothetical protein